MLELIATYAIWTLGTVITPAKPVDSTLDSQSDVDGILVSLADNVKPEVMSDNALRICSIQAEALNKSDISLTIQTLPTNLSDDMDNGEHSMNTDLDMSELKHDEDAERDFFCKDSLCIYSKWL